MVWLFPLIFLAFGTLVYFRINRLYYFVCLLISLPAPPCTHAHTCFPVRCSKLITQLQWGSSKRAVEQKDHFTSPAGSTTALPISWQCNTFSLPATIMPSSFSNDLLLVVPFLVGAIDCWSPSGALCIILPAILFFQMILSVYQVHSAFQFCFPVYPICRFYILFH